MQTGNASPFLWITGQICSIILVICNYSEPCETEEKNVNHACMNERSFLEFHMARSHIEMQHSGIEMGL